MDFDIDLDRELQLEEDLLNENIDLTNISLKRHSCLPDSNDETSAKRIKLPEPHISSNVLNDQEPTTSTNVIERTKPSLLRHIPLEGDYTSVTYTDGVRYYLPISEVEEESLPNLTAADRSFTSSSLTLDALELATNRTLLRWLKAWDQFVFGRGDMSHSNPIQQTSSSSSSGVQSNKQFVSKFDELEQLASQIDPRDHLPTYKLILLTGPPGLGKTTLAHLLAKHAGYQVVEMNASDDRSVSMFHERLSAIVSTTSSLNWTRDEDKEGARFKPCCLVLDEIDGAVPAAVELLIKAAKRKGPKEESSRKRSRDALSLRRPVICICNDIYSPSVRPLRAPGVPCLVLRLPRVDLSTLISRLYQIALSEELPVDKMQLTQLAEQSDRDVRACLNTMQFLKSTLAASPVASCSSSSPASQPTVDLVKLLLNVRSVGVKDVERNLFDLWKAVFTIPSTRLLASYRPSTTNRVASSTNQAIDTSVSARMKYVMELVNFCPDLSLFVNGIFENYFRGRMKDASLNTACRAANWFTFHDLINSFIQRHVDYTAFKFLFYLPAWFHLALATPSGFIASYTSGAESRKQSGLQWPVAASDSTSSQSRCLACLEQLKSNQWSSPVDSPHGLVSSSAAAKERHTSLRFLSRRNFLLDSAPFLTSLVSSVASSLRPLNAQLYSRTEKENLNHLVSFMLNTGLDWTAERNEETHNVELCLDPALDTLTRFGAANTCLASIPFNTKQFIAREIHLERTRRLAHSVTTAISSESSKVAKSRSSSDVPTPIALPTQPTFQSGSLNLAKPVATKVPSVKRDFFGRPIVVSKPVKSDVKPVSNLICTEVYYRFKEGFSNAVNRPAQLKAFL